MVGFDHLCDNWRHGLQHIEDVSRAYGTEEGMAFLERSYHQMGLTEEFAPIYGMMGVSLRSQSQFFVTDTICDLIEVGSDKLTGPIVFEPSLTPSMHGFVWLAKGNTSSVDLAGPLRAISWVHHTDTGDPENYGAAVHINSPDDAQGLVLFFWVMIPERPHIPPAPMAMVRLNYHEPMPEDTSHKTMAKLKFALSFFYFINQHIVEVSAAPQSRAERRRKNEGTKDNTPSMSIVQLRKRYINQATSPSASRSVEWRHQWLVSGHWRRQWLPSSKTHAPRWINPYVKGPEDKPLKQTKTTIHLVKR